MMMMMIVMYHIMVWHCCAPNSWSMVPYTTQSFGFLYYRIYLKIEKDKQRVIIFVLCCCWLMNTNTMNVLSTDWSKKRSNIKQQFCLNIWITTKWVIAMWSPKTNVVSLSKHMLEYPIQTNNKSFSHFKY